MRYLILTLLLICLLQIPLQAQLDIQWSDPIDVAPNTFRNDYPRIVLNNENKPLITWGGNNKVYFSKLTNSGFIDPVQINNDTTEAYVATWTGADLVNRNDTIYIGFMHKEWGKKTYLVRSFDNGTSFSSPVLVENYQDSTSRFPTVAINQAGHPIVGVMKMTLNEADPHYVVRKSYDYGASFTGESNVGGWSGAESIACDCCPSTMKAKDNKVAIFYRDNLNNIRDIWATVSTDYGATFSQGFNVDEHQWQIFGCPSSGPDAVIIGDTLYTVFMSDGLSYLSKASISDGSLASVLPLGETPVSGVQNFPRIDNYNNAVAISWRGNFSGTKLYLSYTEDITSGQPFLQDTVFLSSLSSADLAMDASGIHIAIEALDDGTVKYMHGVFSTTPTLEIYAPEATIYPNPANQFLNIIGYEHFERFNIFNTFGALELTGLVSKSIDISKLSPQSYILELVDANNNSWQKRFVKFND